MGTKIGYYLIFYRYQGQESVKNSMGVSGQAGEAGIEYAMDQWGGCFAKY
jgi:hypothetical protein